MIGLFILFGIVIGHVTPVVCETAIDAQNLQTELFVTKAYNKKIKPIMNQSHHSIEVEMLLYLNSLDDLDEVNEVMKTTGYLHIVWTDEFLKWDPADYGNLIFAVWPQTDIWKPDVTLRNSNTKHKELGSDSLNVNVDNAGTVNWMPIEVFESTCDINTRNYPFDEQTCHLRFVAWSYPVYEVNLNSRDEGLYLNEYDPNHSWDIVNTSWSVSYDNLVSELIFSIKMKRKPLFVATTLIFPIILLSLMNIFVFALPSESGERSGYAVTVFLALVVFLSIVSIILPANSDTIAVFSIYLIIQTVVSTLTTLIALITIRLNNLDKDTPIPLCIIALLRAKDGLICNKGQRTKKTSKTSDSSEEGNSSDKRIEPIAISSIEMEESDKTASRSFNEMQPKYTWKHVNNLLDAVCLIFFSAVCLISTIVCFTLSATDG